MKQSENVEVSETTINGANNMIRDRSGRRDQRPGLGGLLTDADFGLTRALLPLVADA